MHVEKVKNIPKDHVLFCAAFALFVFLRLCENMIPIARALFYDRELNLIFKLLRYAAYGICVARIFYTSRFEKRRLLLFMGAALICLIAARSSGEMGIFLYMFLFVAADGVGSETLIRMVMYIQGIVSCAVLLLAALGLFENYVKVEATRDRYFLGFSWTTTPTILFLFMIWEFIYLHKGRLSLAQTAVMTAISLWLFGMTGTRFAFLVQLLTILFFTVFGRFLDAEPGKIPALFYRLFPAVPWLFAGLAIAGTCFYNRSSAVWLRLNTLLNNRLVLGQDAIREHGISLFGTPIKWYGFSLEGSNELYNYVDSSYVRILLNYGVVFLLLLLAVYSYILYQAVKTRQFWLGWILIFLLGFCITEPRLLDFTYNPFVLLCVTADCPGDARDYRRLMPE